MIPSWLTQAPDDLTAWEQQRWALRLRMVSWALLGELLLLGLLLLARLPAVAGTCLAVAAFGAWAIALHQRGAALLAIGALAAALNLHLLLLTTWMGPAASFHLWFLPLAVAAAVAIPEQHRLTQAALCGLPLFGFLAAELFATPPAPWAELSMPATVVLHLVNVCGVFVALVQLTLGTVRLAQLRDTERS